LLPGSVKFFCAKISPNCDTYPSFAIIRFFQFFKIIRLIWTFLGLNSLSFYLRLKQVAKNIGRRIFKIFNFHGLELPNLATFSYG
jgi:hypothetical protein